MRSKQKTITQVILLFVGCVCIAYGVARGEANTVLAKAIKICLEFIGIG